MASKNPTLSYIGLGIGAFALMLAIVHFWGGPFSPQPKMEQSVAEKAVAIRDAAVARLKGETPPAAEPTRPSYDLDKIASIVTGVTGGLAIILGVIGAALREPLRPAGCAAVLGVGAIAFQFAVLALGIMVIMLVLTPVLSKLDFDIG